MLFLAAADYLAGVANAASKVTCTISGDEITVATGADAGKVLDQRQLAAAAATIYTVPAGTVTVVKTIIVVNTDTVTRTFQLFRGGTGPGNAITSLISLAAGYAWVRDDSGDHVTDTLGQAALNLPNYQPLDSDLTAIAALTTTAYGRALLELANASALADLTSGAAFPTGAALTAYGDDRPYFRTDLGEWYYHHGASGWLSTVEYPLGLTLNAFSVYTVSAQAYQFGLAAAFSGMKYYFTRWMAEMHVTATNNGSNYWSVKVVYRKADLTGSTQLISTTSYSGTPNTAHDYGGAIGTVVDPATYVDGFVEADTVGSPSALVLSAEIFYRKIAT